MKRGWVLFIIGLSVFFVLLNCHLTRAEEAVTHATLASMLIDLLEIELPPGSEHLDETEYFEVEANMLAERGITIFIDSSGGFNLG